LRAFYATNLLNFIFFNTKQLFRSHIRYSVYCKCSGRLTKRPRADTPPVQASDNDCFDENGDYSLKPLRKRLRKASQLPQFGFYQDETSLSDSLKLDAQNEPTPVLFEPQLGKIWPHTRVEIPFHADFEANLTQKTPKKPSKIGNRKPLSALPLIAINGTRKAPKIPQNWMKNQPNDHTSPFFTLFLNISYLLY
jgi:hypothetical protein